MNSKVHCHRLVVADSSLYKVRQRDPRRDCFDPGTRDRCFEKGDYTRYQDFDHVVIERTVQGRRMQVQERAQGVRRQVLQLRQGRASLRGLQHKMRRRRGLLRLGMR